MTSERPQDPVPPAFQNQQSYPQQSYPQQVYQQPYQSGYGNPGYAAQPPNYLAWAVIALFLCLPVAIVALLKSSQVDQFWAMGRPDLAWRASATTRTLCVAATVIGVLAVIVVLVA